MKGVLFEIKQHFPIAQSTHGDFRLRFGCLILVSAHDDVIAAIDHGMIQQFQERGTGFKRVHLDFGPSQTSQRPPENGIDVGSINRCSKSQQDRF